TKAIVVQSPSNTPGDGIIPKSVGAIKQLGITAPSIVNRLMESDLDMDGIGELLSQDGGDVLLNGRQWKAAQAFINNSVEENPPENKVTRIKAALVAEKDFRAEISSYAGYSWLDKLLTNADGNNNNKVWDGLNDFFRSQGLPNTRSYKQQEGTSAVFTREGIDNFKKIINSISRQPMVYDAESNTYSPAGFTISGSDTPLVLDDAFYEAFFEHLGVLGAELGVDEEFLHGEDGVIARLKNNENMEDDEGQPVAMEFASADALQGSSL
ncbi:uncharacterized protein METZ01_LOCUS427939, partial [marine metagenome]